MDIETPHRHRPRPMGILRRLALAGRDLVIDLKRFYFVRIRGMNIHPTVRFSLSTKFDETNPKGVHVGEETMVTFGVAILSHDMSRAFHCDTRIGKRCFIGARSIVMPGVVIGDECIIGAGSVVTKSVPPHSVAVGNPARVVRTDIRTQPYGKLDEAHPGRPVTPSRDA
jgi:acetyltransferase-like isoleucine patch superfamily enzyme